MEDEKYQVQIPANVKIRTELINGIGIKELITTAIAGGFTFIAVMKDKNNSCIASLIINIYKYLKGQKFYKYVVKEKDTNEFIR